MLLRKCCSARVDARRFCAAFQGNRLYRILPREIGKLIRRKPKIASGWRTDNLKWTFDILALNVLFMNIAKILANKFRGNHTVRHLCFLIMLAGLSAS